MTKITCRCITCGYVRSFTEDDLIDESGPSCDVCCRPMIPVKAETMRKTERDSIASDKPTEGA